MENMLTWVSQPAGALVCALAVVALLMIPVFVKLTRQKRFLEDEMRQIEDSLGGSLAALRDANGAERLADREEMNRNLRGMNDSIVSVIGEMSRTQQQQLDSFGGQIRATSRADEERLERMRQSIDDKLQDYDRQMARVTKTLEDKLAVDEQRLTEMRKTLDENMLRLQGENEKKLEQIRLTVDEKLNSTLDKRLEEAEIGKIDKEIAQIKRRPPKDLEDPAARIAELQAERDQLRLDHALSRIEHYPNDIGLVFDLGKLRLERGEYDLAIEQFMESRQSARCEIISRMALAECYEKQGRYDEAVSELETVLSVLPRLDKERLPTTYSLAQIMETTGNKERALALYKELHELEPRFRDVSARIKALEESKVPAAEAAGEETAKE